MNQAECFCHDVLLITMPPSKNDLQELFDSMYMCLHLCETNCIRYKRVFLIETVMTDCNIVFELTLGSGGIVANQYSIKIEY